MSRASGRATLALALAWTACHGARAGPPSDAGIDGAPSLVAGDGATGACAPGAWAPDGAACEAAGVPASACGTGFTADGHGGCTAILPATPCPDFTFARPGEAACVEIGACGDGPWGDAPDDGATEYVDASANPAGADGTRAHPWATVAAAVAHARAGETIALAGGTYAENVVLDRPLTLRGRCPRLTHLVDPPTNADGAALVFTSARVSFAVSDLSMSTPRVAIAFVSVGATPEHLDVARLAVDSSTGLNLDGLHDITVTDSLLVHAGAQAISAVTTDVLHLDVRGVVAIGGGAIGTNAGGIFVAAAPRSPSTLNVVGSVIDGPGISVNVSDMAATVTGTLLRGGANGIVVDVGSITARGIVVEGGTQAPDTDDDHGLFGFNALVDIDATTLRNTRGPAILVTQGEGATTRLLVRRTRIDTAFGTGIIDFGVDDAEIDGVSIEGTVGTVLPAGIRAVTMAGQRFVVDGVDVVGGAVGIVVADGVGTITRARVRALTSAAGGGFGDGVDVFSADSPCRVDIASSSIEGSPRAGVAVFGATLTLADTSFNDCAIDLDGEPFQQGAQTLPFAFEDRGGDVCATGGVAHVCQADTAGLLPPDPSALTSR